MLLPSALRRVAFVAATASMLAVVPLAAAQAADTVSNVSPTGALNDGVKTVTFTVSASYLAVPEPTVTFQRTADTTESVAVPADDVTVSGSTITAAVNLANRNPGAWNITVSGATAAPSADPVVSSCTGCFTVLALAPDITTISPTSIRANESGTLTVNGSRFTASNYCTSGPCTDQPKLTVSGTGVTLTGTSNATSSAITKSMTVAASAPTGRRDITVTHTDGKSDVCTGCLLIAPQVTGVAYSENTGVSSYGQGAVDRTLTVSGHGFQPGAEVTFASPTGITKNATRVLSTNTIEVDLTLTEAGNAAAPTTGNHAVTVTNPDTGAHASTHNFVITTGPQLAKSGISPNVRGRGTTSTVTFTGSGFSTGGVDIFIQDATVTPGTPTSTSVTATVVVGSGLNIAGDRDVTIVNKGDKGQFICRACFTITNLQINSISPGNLLNDGTHALTIYGSGIANDAKATFTKSGQTDVVATTTQVDGNGNWMTVQIPLSGVAPGAWNVRVDNPSTNPGTGVCTCTLNVVAAAPDITSVNPATLGEGAVDETVTITGTGFFPGATVDFSNAGVTHVVKSVTTTSIVLEVDVADGSADGPTVPTTDAPHVAVANTDGQSDTSAFTVATGPTAESIDVTRRARGTTTPITLTGLDIANGATLLVSGTGITLGTATVTQGATPVADDTVTVPVTIAADAPLSARTVTVRNPDGGRATCPACTLTITAQPTVTSVSPNTAPVGTTKVVTVSGTDFAPGATVDPGAGVTATVTANTPTALTVSLNVSPTAAVGDRSLTVNNGDGGTATLAQAYKVIAVPTAPSNVTATRGDRSAVVSWTASANDGGDPITHYTVVANPGGRTATTPDGSTTTATVTELVNGTAYTFTVFATNGAGPGPSSAASAPVTPATVPGAPTAVSAVAGNAEVSLTWTAPADNGGETITGYRITTTPGGTVKDVTGTTATITGLINGTAYTFAVAAKNVVGHGTATDSNTVTPATVPGAPRDVAAVPGNASAVVTWDAPESDGGSAITGYKVTSTPAGEPVLVGADAREATVAGLTNGTAYTFTVEAINAKGTGAPATSPSVTPFTVPGAPTGVTATAGNQSAHVTWTAPADTNGSPITGYTVVASPGGQEVEVGGDTTEADVTGLTNGTAYTFTVIAKNAAGNSAASAPSNAVTPANVPGAPTSVTATAGHGEATVSWTAPADNGSAITGYTVTTSPGGATKTVTGTSTTVTGLTNGTSYTFTVKAINAAGTGAAGTSNAVVPTWVTTLTEAATVIVGTGGTANVKGALVRSDGVGIVGATIEIYRRVAPGTSYAFLKTVRTGSNGAWATSSTVTKNTYWQARFAGAQGYDPAVSPIRLTKVRYKVTAAYSQSGRTVTVKGAVTPNAAGRTVYLRMRRSDGSLVTLAKTTVAANGTYRMARSFSRGGYTVFVYIANSTTNVAGSSPRVWLRVS